MKRYITLLLCACLMATGMQAQFVEKEKRVEQPVQERSEGILRSLTKGLEYTLRAGFSLGGTSPLPLPAEIRGINSYNPTVCIAIEGDVHKRFGDWGFMFGLRLETKGMQTDARVKNYHMEMVQGGKRLKGYYTGNEMMSTESWLVTLPVRATFSINDNLLVRLGPYFSYVNSPKFDGYVYNGYLRENTPTGTKIVMGADEESGATFDFSDDMRRFQFGIDAGVDWNFYRRWGMYAEVSWGLTSIFKKDFNTIEQKLYPIYGTLGVTYKLK